MNDGIFFCGDRPTMVDFQLLATTLHLNKMFGAVHMRRMMSETSPSANKAYQSMSQRPNILKWMSGGFNGERFYPEVMDKICATSTPYASKKMKLFMKAGCP